jgi:hypothetical protein
LPPPAPALALTALALGLLAAAALRRRGRGKLALEYRHHGLIAQRQEQLAQTLAEPGGWNRVLAQVLADALPGVDPGWLGLETVTGSPPSFAVSGEGDGDRYTFTVSPPPLSSAVPLDASLHPATRIEVQAVWAHLMGQQLKKARALPRRTGWFLIVQRKGRKPWDTLRRR